MTMRLAQACQGFLIPDIQPAKILVYCATSFLLLSTLALAEEPANFDQYDPDVAALLDEYHAESDKAGSLLPSVWAYQGQSKAETLIDFERGLINITAADPSEIKQAAIEILLTQIDPTVIDASTASDLGLINPKTQKPFLFKQVIDQDGAPIASAWRAERYVDYLMTRRSNTRASQLTIPMIGQHKVVAGTKYVNFAKAAGAKHMIPVALIMAIMETESSFNPLARSRSNALGLMQIKADTAGRDYF